MNTISQRKLFEGIGDITEPVEVVRNDRATGQMTKLGTWVPAGWSGDSEATTTPLSEQLGLRVSGAPSAFDSRLPMDTPKGTVKAATPAPSGTFNPVPKPGGGKKR